MEKNGEKWRKMEKYLMVFLLLNIISLDIQVHTSTSG